MKMEQTVWQLRGTAWRVGAVLGLIGALAATAGAIYGWLLEWPWAWKTIHLVILAALVWLAVARVAVPVWRSLIGSGRGALLWPVLWLGPGLLVALPLLERLPRFVRLEDLVLAFILVQLWVGVEGHLTRRSALRGGASVGEAALQREQKRYLIGRSAFVAASLFFVGLQIVRWLGGGS